MSLSINSSSTAENNGHGHHSPCVGASSFSPALPSVTSPSSSPTTATRTSSVVNCEEELPAGLVEQHVSPARSLRRLKRKLLLQHAGVTDLPPVLMGRNRSGSVESATTSTSIASSGGCTATAIWQQQEHNGTMCVCPSSPLPSHPPSSATPPTTPLPTYPS
mmetsp:Transcript_7284/g.17827  ORF Transcript_7284/g.17827 Transcript_7284/m.17827 type:complete len:162 (+) Transcript_7284:279-764(+)